MENGQQEGRECKQKANVAEDLATPLSDHGSQTTLVFLHPTLRQNSHNQLHAVKDR